MRICRVSFTFYLVNGCYLNISEKIEKSAECNKDWENNCLLS